MSCLGSLRINSSLLVCSRMSNRWQGEFRRSVGLISRHSATRTLLLKLSVDQESGDTSLKVSQCEGQVCRPLRVSSDPVSLLHSPSKLLPAGAGEVSKTSNRWGEVSKGWYNSDAPPSYLFWGDPVVIATTRSNETRLPSLLPDTKARFQDGGDSKRKI